MSRIKVEAKASQKSLVFQPIDQDSEAKPTLLLPGDILSPGNSIGGFVAVPDTKGQTWGFWRISGSKKDLLRDPELRLDEVLVNGVTRYVREIRRIVRGEDPTSIARNRGRYLLAVTSGSARRGLLHNADRPSNPLLDAMRNRRISTDSIETLAQTDGQYTEEYNYLFPRYHTMQELFTDGTKTILTSRRGEDVHSGYNPNYPSGNGFSEEVVSIEGSTYVIIALRSQSANNIGPSKPPLVGARILLTPQADIPKVAETFKKIF